MSLLLLIILLAALLLLDLAVWFKATDSRDSHGSDEWELRRHWRAQR